MVLHTPEVASTFLMEADYFYTEFRKENKSDSVWNVF
jgi:hypothetical protein